MFRITIDITELLKIAIPTVLGLLVLYFQMARNRRMQAEGTFFNLLNSIRSMVANTEGRVVKVVKSTFENRIDYEFKGINYFTEANKELQKRLSEALGNAILDQAISTQVKDKQSIEAMHQLAKDTYNVFFKEHLPELAHYYRFTFNVLNFVHTHPDINKKKKIQYIKFIQSQMSDSELQLLYYNGIGQHGSKYYDLIERYNFLENIATSGNKGFIESLEYFYPKSKFRL